LKIELVAHNPSGIHGIGHAARIFVWVIWIGEELIKSGINVDSEVVRPKTIG